MSLPHFLRRRQLRTSVAEERYGDVRVVNTCTWYVSRWRKRVVIQRVHSELESLRERRWPR